MALKYRKPLLTYRIPEWIAGLVEHCRRKRINGGELARRLEIHPGTVSEWLGDDYCPTLETFFTLCDKVGVLPEDLIANGRRIVAEERRRSLSSKSDPVEVDAWVEKLMELPEPDREAVLSRVLGPKEEVAAG
ncbi:MAG: helix-turn-helix transcriptional regulator [bacterium]|nr:helix-turn-helix transcriptional regulator [bacterium]